MSFVVGDLVHSSLYKFGKIVTLNTWLTVEWEVSDVFKSTGNKTSYTADGKGALGIVAIKKVEDRADFDPETGKHKNWQIQEMDKFYNIKK
jgi:hypothetical protein